jgi:hypothetical protein
MEVVTRTICWIDQQSGKCRPYVGLVVLLLDLIGDCHKSLLLLDVNNINEQLKGLCLGLEFISFLVDNFIAKESVFFYMKLWYSKNSGQCVYCTRMKYTRSR